MAWALEPYSLRVAGLSTILELPMVRDGRLVWVCLYLLMYFLFHFSISLYLGHSCCQGMFSSLL